MQDNKNLSIVNTFHILRKKASERKLVKWVQVGISRSLFFRQCKKRPWLWKLHFILVFADLLFLLASNGMIQPEKRLRIKMNISEVMRTQQENCKQFIWISKIVHFLPFTTAKSKVGCCMLLHSLFAFVTYSYLQLLKWSGLCIKFRVGRGLLILSLSTRLLIPSISIYRLVHNHRRFDVWREISMIF